MVTVAGNRKTSARLNIKSKKSSLLRRYRMMILREQWFKIGEIYVFEKSLAVGAVAIAALFVGNSAHEAQAVEITIDSVTGTWSNVTGPAVNLSRTGTNKIFSARTRVWPK